MAASASSRVYTARLAAVYWQRKGEFLEDIHTQIEMLRRRMKLAARRAGRRAAAEAEQAPARAMASRLESRRQLEEHVPGCEVETPHGRHWETTRLFGANRRHGSFELSRLQELPSDLLREISQGEIAGVPVERWAFLDTETTGLAGGSGTCAFLVGIGRVTREGFEVRQFFMRDYPEEHSQLTAVSAAMEDAEVLISYNGKAFDIPLLETRYRLKRTLPPFANTPHLDLLHGARRLWRLRFESCKLTELEARVLGHEREDDIPGELIPVAYFDFLRGGTAHRLAPVFVHNALDIVALACLTGIVPWAFREPGAMQLSHGAEFVSLGRWLRQSGEMERARDLFRQALGMPLEDELAYRSMWDLAEVEKKLDGVEAALALYRDLAGVRNPHQADALVELAKHYEHSERDLEKAEKYAKAALETGDSLEIRRRLGRVQGKKAKAAGAGSLW